MCRFIFKSQFVGEKRNGFRKVDVVAPLHVPDDVHAGFATTEATGHQIPVAVGANNEGRICVPVVRMRTVPPKAFSTSLQIDFPAHVVHEIDPLLDFVYELLCLHVIAPFVFIGDRVRSVDRIMQAPARNFLILSGSLVKRRHDLSFQGHCVLRTTAYPRRQGHVPQGKDPFSYKQTYSLKDKHIYLSFKKGLLKRSNALFGTRGFSI